MGVGGGGTQTQQATGSDISLKVSKQNLAQALWSKGSPVP